MLRQMMGGETTIAQFVVEDPATGLALASVPDIGPDDATAAIDMASAAAQAWRERSPRERGECLHRAFGLVLADREGYVEEIVAESGKTRADADAEVVYGADFRRWYAEEAVRIEGTVATAPSGRNRMLVLRQPVGIAVLVTPWNFPLAMITRKLAPALAAGCTVVVKPAPETPLTALRLAQTLERAGVPQGVVNVVTTRRSAEVVGTLLSDARVRKLSITGSTEVGKRPLAQASEHVLKCSMELGGNAPFIVLADADVDAAVQSAVVAKLRNGGQSCTAANRFHVHRSVAAPFAQRLADAMSTTRVGPLINAAARTKVAALVDDAVARGARPLCGGYVPDGPGFFYPATVLADVPLTARIMREEVFGPVAPISLFDDHDEVLRLANATPFGLVSFIQGGDLGTSLTLAEHLDTGMVGIDRGVVSDVAAPFGGWKQSGLGREGGRLGLEEYLETKYIALEWAR
jgi:succinate-semialdehyde dehydrogenase/glutarate-semialdehyde dehydrogenase